MFTRAGSVPTTGVGVHSMFLPGPGTQGLTVASTSPTESFAAVPAVVRRVPVAAGWTW